MRHNPIAVLLYHITRHGWPWCMPLHWLRIFSASRMFFDGYLSCPVCRVRYAD